MWRRDCYGTYTPVLTNVCVFSGVISLDVNPVVEDYELWAWVPFTVLLCTYFVTLFIERQRVDYDPTGFQVAVLVLTVGCVNASMRIFHD